MREPEHLDAIRAAPDKDAPRLVFADWLDEKGDPRGELIALGCKLAKRPNAKLKARFAELATEAEEELEELGAAIYDWDRGFIDAVYIATGDLVKHARTLLERAPLLRLIETQLFSEADARKLARLPQLAGIRALRWGASGGDARARGRIHAAFFAAAKLPALVELDAYSDVGYDAVARLVGNPTFGNLGSLKLDGKLGPDAMRTLAAWPGLAKVRRLNLSVCGLDDKAIAPLAGSPHLGALEELELTSNWIGEAGARSLLELQAPRLSRLVLGFQQGAKKRVTSATNARLAKRFRDFTPATAKITSP